jgi:Cystatin domain
MNLLPRSFATMALAVAAVPGVAPLAAPLHQHGHPAVGQHRAEHGRTNGTGTGADRGNGHGTTRPQPHAPGRPAAHPAGRPVGHGMGKAAPVSARVAAPSAGGWTEQNPASPAVLSAAGFAAVSLSETFGGTYVVEHVKRAEAQVVEGENYRLTLRIALLENEVLGARKDCTVVVWSRPWLKPADELTSADCQNAGTAVPAAPAAPAVAAKVVVADAKVAPVAVKADAKPVDPKHACLAGKADKAEKVVRADKAAKAEQPGRAPVRV